MNNDYDENSEQVFKKLNYFLSNEQAIHFKTKTGDWRNAIIKSIDKENSVVHLKEFKFGNIVIFFWDIQEETITAYTTKVEKEEEDVESN